MSDFESNTLYNYTVDYALKNFADLPQSLKDAGNEVAQKTFTLKIKNYTIKEIFDDLNLKLDRDTFFSNSSKVFYELASYVSLFNLKIVPCHIPASIELDSPILLTKKPELLNDPDLSQINVLLSMKRGLKKSHEAVLSRANVKLINYNVLLHVFEALFLVTRNSTLELAQKDALNDYIQNYELPFEGHNYLKACYSFALSKKIYPCDLANKQYCYKDLPKEQTEIVLDILLRLALLSVCNLDITPKDPLSTALKERYEKVRSTIDPAHKDMMHNDFLDIKNPSFTINSLYQGLFLYNTDRYGQNPYKDSDFLQKEQICNKYLNILEKTLIKPLYTLFYDYLKNELLVHKGQVIASIPNPMLISMHKIGDKFFAFVSDDDMELSLNKNLILNKDSNDFKGYKSIKLADMRQVKPKNAHKHFAGNTLLSLVYYIYILNDFVKDKDNQRPKTFINTTLDIESLYNLLNCDLECLKALVNPLIVNTLLQSYTKEQDKGYLLDKLETILNDNSQLNKNFNYLSLTLCLNKYLENEDKNIGAESVDGLNLIKFDSLSYKEKELFLACEIAQFILIINDGKKLYKSQLKDIYGHTNIAPLARSIASLILKYSEYFGFDNDLKALFDTYINSLIKTYKYQFYNYSTDSNNIFFNSTSNFVMLLASSFIRYNKIYDFANNHGLFEHNKTLKIVEFISHLALFYRSYLASFTKLDSTYTVKNNFLEYIAICSFNYFCNSSNKELSDGSLSIKDRFFKNPHFVTNALDGLFKDNESRAAFIYTLILTSNCYIYPISAFVFNDVASYAKDHESTPLKISFFAKYQDDENKDLNSQDFLSLRLKESLECFVYLYIIERLLLCFKELLNESNIDIILQAYAMRTNLSNNYRMFLYNYSKKYYRNYILKNYDYSFELSKQTELHKLITIIKRIKGFIKSYSSIALKKTLSNYGIFNTHTYFFKFFQEEFLHFTKILLSQNKLISYVGPILSQKLDLMDLEIEKASDIESQNYIKKNEQKFDLDFSLINSKIEESYEVQNTIGSIKESAENGVSSFINKDDNLDDIKTQDVLDNNKMSQGSNSESKVDDDPCVIHQESANKDEISLNENDDNDGLDSTLKDFIKDISKSNEDVVSLDLMKEIAVKYAFMSYMVPLEVINDYCYEKYDEPFFDVDESSNSVFLSLYLLENII